MTDAELFELIAIIHSNAISVVALYLTAVTGYLIAAYMVGEKLSSLQTTVVTVLFLWIALFCTYGAIGYFSRTMDFHNQLSVKPSGLAMNVWVAYIIGGFQTLGIFACCKFMWDVRHPKTE